jgi:hypothetical protein
MQFLAERAPSFDVFGACQFRVWVKHRRAFNSEAHLAIVACVSLYKRANCLVEPRAFYLQDQVRLSNDLSDPVVLDDNRDWRLLRYAPPMFDFSLSFGEVFAELDDFSVFHKSHQTITLTD